MFATTGVHEDVPVPVVAPEREGSGSPAEAENVADTTAVGLAVAPETAVGAEDWVGSTDVCSATEDAPGTEVEGEDEDAEETEACQIRVDCDERRT